MQSEQEDAEFSPETHNRVGMTSKINYKMSLPQLTRVSVRSVVNQNQADVKRIRNSDNAQEISNLSSDSDPEPEHESEDISQQEVQILDQEPANNTDNGHQVYRSIQEKRLQQNTNSQVTEEEVVFLDVKMESNRSHSVDLTGTLNQQSSAMINPLVNQSIQKIGNIYSLIEVLRNGIESQGTKYELEDQLLEQIVQQNKNYNRRFQQQLERVSIDLEHISLDGKIIPYNSPTQAREIISRPLSQTNMVQRFTTLDRELLQTQSITIQSTQNVSMVRIPQSSIQQSTTVPQRRKPSINVSNPQVQIGANLETIGDASAGAIKPKPKKKKLKLNLVAPATDYENHIDPNVAAMQKDLNSFQNTGIAGLVQQNTSSSNIHIVDTQKAIEIKSQTIKPKPKKKKLRINLVEPTTNYDNHIDPNIAAMQKDINTFTNTGIDGLIHQNTSPSKMRNAQTEQDQIQPKPSSFLTSYSQVPLGMEQSSMSEIQNQNDHLVHKKSNLTQNDTPYLGKPLTQLTLDDTIGDLIQNDPELIASSSNSKNKPVANLIYASKSVPLQIRVDSDFKLESAVISSDKKHASVKRQDSLFSIHSNQSKMSVYRRKMTSQFETAGQELTKKELMEKFKFYKEYFDKHETQSDKKKASLDIGFLFASPLVFESESNFSDQKMIQNAIPQLQFLQEAKAIKDSIKKSGQNVSFKSTVLTQNNFIEMLKKGKAPKMLHISCHGIECSQETMGYQYHEKKQDGNFLLFENNFGEGELVSQSILNKMVSQTMPDLDLVFVAACKSDFVGRIFQKTGAKHVICVKQEKEILDDAAIAFTKSFYYQVFIKQNICDAFERALADTQCQFQKHEANKFQILLQENCQYDEDLLFPMRNLSSQHQCFNHFRMNAGQLNCISDHVKIKFVPDKIKNLMGREKQLSKIVKSVMDGQSTIMLLGLHGVGKSALAKNAIHYMLERKYFTGGVMFVNLKGVSKFSQLTVKLKKTITKHLDLNYGNIRDELENVSSESFVDFLVDLFDAKDLDAKLKYKKKCGDSTVHKFLLCLDNAEELITDSADQFSDFISKMASCVLVTTLITSNRYSSQKFYVMRDGQSPEIIFLKPLGLTDSVNLFVDHAGDILPDQIFKLIMCDQKYPIKKLVSELEGIPNPVSSRVKEKIMYYLQNPRKQVQALAIHDLFKQLSGNPLSIIMMAAVHKVKSEHSTPIMNKHNSDTSLSADVGASMLEKVYELVKSERESIDDDAINSQRKSIHGKKMPQKNNMSLRISTEASLSLLQETQQISYELFYFMGCLKDGIKLEALNELWGENVTKYIDSLEQLSLLEVGSSKVQLNPYLTEYSQQTIDKESKTKFHITICSYYTNFLENLYQVNQALNPEERIQNQDGWVELDGESSNKSQTPSHTTSEHTTQTQCHLKYFKMLINKQLQNSSVSGNVSQKQVLEQVLVGMGNIDHCINHFSELCEGHIDEKPSHINEFSQLQNGETTLQSMDISNINSQNYSHIENLTVQNLGSITSSNPGNEEGQEVDNKYLDNIKLDDRMSPKIQLNDGTSELSKQKELHLQRSMTGSSLQESILSDNQFEMNFGGENDFLKDDDPQSFQPDGELEQNSKRIQKRKPTFQKLLTLDDGQVQKTILVEQCSDDGGLSKKSSVNSHSSVGRTFQRARSDEEGELVSISEDNDAQEKQSQSRVSGLRKNWRKRNLLKQDTLLPDLDIVSEENLSDFEENSFDLSDSEAAKSNILQKEDLGTKLNNINEKSKVEIKRIKTKVIKDIILQPTRQKTMKETLMQFRQNSEPKNKELKDKDPIELPDFSKCNVEDSLGLILTGNFAKSQNVERSSTKNRLICLGIGERQLSDSSDSNSSQSGHSQKSQSQEGDHNRSYSSSLEQSEDSACKFLNIQKQQDSEETTAAQTSQVFLNLNSGLSTKFQNSQVSLNQNLNLPLIADINLETQNKGSNFKRISSEQKRTTQKKRLHFKQSLNWIESQLDESVNQSYLKLKRSDLHNKRTHTSISLMRFRANTLMVTKINKELSIEGRFILFTVANALLSDHYDYCLRICSTNFTYVANSFLFEGNILRFKALAIHLIHEKGHNQEEENLLQDQGASTEGQELQKAQNALENAIKIFRLSVRPIIKGIALAQYHLAYLLKENPSLFFSATEIETVIPGTKGSLAQIEVYQKFQEAYDGFKKVNHLQGMYQSKKHMVEIGKKMLEQAQYTKSACVDDIEAQYQTDMDKTDELLNKIESYRQQVGMHQSSYISREQGEDISLISELVLKENNINCFPQNAHTQDRISRNVSKSSTGSFKSISGESQYSVKRKRQVFARNKEMIYSEQLPDANGSSLNLDQS